MRERVAPSAPGLQGRKRVAALFTVCLAVMLLTLAVLASGIIDEHTFHTLWVAGIAYCGGICSMYLCAKFSQRRYIANLLTDDSTLLSELRVTLDGDGVACFDAAKTTRYSWRAFSDVTEQADRVVARSRSRPGRSRPCVGERRCRGGTSSRSSASGSHRPPRRDASVRPECGRDCWIVHSAELCRDALPKLSGGRERPGKRLIRLMIRD